MVGSQSGLGLNTTNQRVNLSELLGVRDVKAERLISGQTLAGNSESGEIQA